MEGPLPSAPLRVYWPSHHLRHMTRSELDARIASGEFTVTKLPTRKARKSELVFSMTKGPRTNTNRRGQNYTGHATHAEQAVVQGNAGAYFKTSG